MLEIGRPRRRARLRRPELGRGPDPDPGRDRPEPAGPAHRRQGLRAPHARHPARRAGCASARRCAGASTSASTRPRRSRPPRATWLRQGQARPRRPGRRLLPHGRRQPAAGADGYGKDIVPYAQLYFDSSPLRHAAAWRKLASLGDDSSTYLWRVLAARDIMRLYRSDPSPRARGRAADRTRRRPRRSCIRRAHDGVRRPLRGRPRAGIGRAARDQRGGPRPYGLQIDSHMGELARRAGPIAAPVSRPAPQALAILQAIGAATQAIGGAEPLVVTSTRARRALPARPRGDRPRGHDRLLAAHHRLRFDIAARLPQSRARRSPSSSCSTA